MTGVGWQEMPTTGSPRASSAWGASWLLPHTYLTERDAVQRKERCSSSNVSRPPVEKIKPADQGVAMKAVRRERRNENRRDRASRSELSQQSGAQRIE
jgi:hypothetical protein